MSRLLIQADARAIPLRDGSVQTVVTSPPYWGLRDYGVPGQLGLERTPEEYVAAMVAVFREVRRVLRSDGTLWLNLGDSYAANRSYQVGSTKGGAKHSPAQDALGASSVPDGLKPKDLVGIPWRVAFALQADGWYLRSDIIWAKPNPMPESVTDRPTKAHEYLFLLAKSERYYYDAEAVKEGRATDDPRPPHGPGQMERPASGTRTKQDTLGKQTYTGFNGRWKAKRLAEAAVARSGGALSGGTENSRLGESRDLRNRRTVWTVATQPYSGAHFATFPEKLIEPCVLAGAPKGGIVFDPFGGSGTTVRVARRLGRRGVACELNRVYIALAKQRSGAGIQMEILP